MSKALPITLKSVFDDNKEVRNRNFPRCSPVHNYLQALYSLTRGSTRQQEWCQNIARKKQPNSILWGDTMACLTILYNIRQIYDASSLINIC